MYLKSAVLALALGASASAQCQSASEMLAPLQRDRAANAPVTRVAISSKEDFLREAAKGGDWWKEWGVDRYSDGGATIAMVEKSAVVKAILQKERNLIIPFEPGRISAVRGTRVREALMRGELVPSRAGTNWCEGLTPVDIASSVAAVTAYVAPEYTYPRGTPSNVRQNSREYLQTVFKGLEAYCSPLDNGAFVSAFRSFLDEYARVIQRAYAQAQAAVQGAEEAKRQQEAASAQAEAERKAAASAAAAEAARAKAEQKERDKVAAKAREQEATERRQRQRDEEAQYASDLRSKKVAPRSLDDFVLLHDAQAGLQIIAFPPLVPDRKAYLMNGRFEKQDGPFLVFSVSLRNDTRYFAVRASPAMFKEEGFALRFEYPAKVIGRLVGSMPYSTIAGMQRQMPVFEGIALGSVR